MSERLRSIPNLISWFRLFLVPVLWVLALRGDEFNLGLLLAVAFISDGLDGFIARRFKLTTKFGSKLDSVADAVLQISAWIWLFMLEPEVIRNHAWLFWTASVISAGSMLTGLIKFGGLPNLHLYSTKAAGFFVTLFLVTTFIFEGYSAPLFYVTATLVTIGAAETFLLQLISRKINEHMGSLILALFKRDTVS
ncbi:MAG: CDP-alcohol phosphatidyltransferase family protein [Anaerolineae bacterium]|nr:CDP-alcohol phosphatidyltransferase family protein [Anaerolineae bacterium]